MLLVYGNKVSFQYEQQNVTLLSEISFFINNNSRVGLVGKNGAGKTTLFKLILGQLNNFEGVIKRSEAIKIGYLPQELVFESKMRAIDYLWQSNPKLYDVKLKLSKEDMTKRENLFLYSDYEDLGGYQLESKMEQALASVGLSEVLLTRKICFLSGGEKTKLALARLLVEEVDLVLFDEPTNHLDLDTLCWLEDYLGKANFSFIIISHDRSFLDRSVTEIWEIKERNLRVFSGNYSFYKNEIEKEYQSMQSKYEMQQKKIKQLEKTASERKQWAFTHQAQTGKNGYAPVYESVTNFSKHAMKRAKNVEKRVEMMLEKEKKEKPRLEKKRSIRFAPDLKNGSKVALEIRSLSKGYQTSLFHNLNLFIATNSRVAIVGRNGCGKTTLLKIVMGLELADAGECYLPPSILRAYFAQGYDKLNFAHTIMEEVVGHDMSNQSHARTILGCLGIEKEDVFKKIEVLSIGQRSKVSLAKAILSGANFLILDEPTNHLEISAREAIEEALAAFEGTILFVSHDRRFIDKIAGFVFDLESQEMIRKCS